MELTLRIDTFSGLHSAKIARTPQTRCRHSEASLGEVWSEQEETRTGNNPSIEGSYSKLIAYYLEIRCDEHGLTAHYRSEQICIYMNYCAAIPLSGDALETLPFI